jgi:hypothetical protein
MHQVMVTAGPDGKFVIDRVPAGEHSVAASQMRGMGSTSAVTTAVVTAGKRTAIALDIAVGNVALTVEIVPKAGAQVDAAQIFVAKGAVTATTAKQLTDALKGGGADGSRMLFWFGGAAQTFDKLVPGPISICTIPITGNLRDTTFSQRLQSNVDTLDVYCVQHTVPAAPEKQTFRHEVPAMKPLPPT